MLCSRCEEALDSVRRARIAARGESLAVPLCAECGALVSPEDTTERLLIKLTQLGRFGLVATNPVLRPRPRPQPEREPS